MIYSMWEPRLAPQPGRGSDEGSKVSGLRRAWEWTYFARIRPVLFYCSKIVNWHTSPPSTEMPQRHAKGLWQKVFLLGHLGSCAWKGVWLTPNMMPSARSIHFSFALCVMLLLCTHSKWQTTCVFYLLKRSSQLGWLWNAGLVEKSFFLDTMLFYLMSKAEVVEGPAPAFNLCWGRGWLMQDRMWLCVFL